MSKPTFAKALVRCTLTGAEWTTILAVLATVEGRAQTGLSEQGFELFKEARRMLGNQLNAQADKF